MIDTRQRSGTIISNSYCLVIDRLYNFTCQFQTVACHHLRLTCIEIRHEKNMRMRQRTIVDNKTNIETINILLTKDFAWIDFCKIEFIAFKLGTYWVKFFRLSALCGSIFVELKISSHLCTFSFNKIILIALFYLHKKIKFSIENFFMLNIELIAKDLWRFFKAFEPFYFYIVDYGFYINWHHWAIY